MNIGKLHIWDRNSIEVWTYVTILSAFVILYVCWNYFRTVRLILHLDGPPAVPILGNANSALKDDVLERMAYETPIYGRVFRVWLTVLPYVVLTEPEDIQIVLSNPKHTKKIFFYRLLDNFLGKGLITRDVDTWRVHRKILQPAFHVNMLERFTYSFADCAYKLTDKLLPFDNKDINITTFINDSVYDILSETVLGLNNSSDKEELPFRKGHVTVLQRLNRPWLLVDWVYRMTKIGREEDEQRKNLFDACFKMIENKRESHEQSDKFSLLQYMLEVNEKNPCFTKEGIVEECCTFMLAGQDSVGTATAMTLFLLANHPEWQDQCYRELNDIFHDDPTRAPTMKDLKDMRILEMCLKETLRLYPSVPIFARTLGEDVKIGKYVLPTGCGVFVVPYSTHRLPHYFPDPHTYKPERFSPENSEGRHPYAYLPFSAGPRNCIGYKFAMLEMKAIISTILRKFKLQSVVGKKDLKPKFRMTVRAQGGLWIKLVIRNNNTYQN